MVDSAVSVMVHPLYPVYHTKSHVDGGEGRVVGRGGIWVLLVLSTQFYHEPKTHALKNKIYYF